MTRLALGAKWDGFGARGSSGEGAVEERASSAAIRRETMAGKRTEPPTSERIMVRREGVVVVAVVGRIPESLVWPRRRGTRLSARPGRDHAAERGGRTAVRPYMPRRGTRPCALCRVHGPWCGR